MMNIGKTEQLLIIGLVGLSALLLVAYLNPIVLQNSTLSDFTFYGVIAKVGAILSFIGFFAFFHNAPQTYKKLTPNILRVFYMFLFVAVSFCSESQWECFI